MTPMIKGALVAAALLCAVPATQAQEAAFLNSLNGSFQGTGTVKVRTNASPVNVNCTFTSTATATSLNLNGRCRGLVVVSRAISARLKATGGRYSGSYVGAGTGPAGLSGRRAGNSINLGVRWAKNVNGDRKAQLSATRIARQSSSCCKTQMHARCPGNCGFLVCIGCRPTEA